MIVADFFKSKSDKLTGFRITGHAGFGEYGHDVACASVSSAVMLTANTITEAFKLNADVVVNENEIIVKLVSDDEGLGDKAILGLLTHMYFLSEDYTGSIKVKVIDN